MKLITEVFDTLEYLQEADGNGKKAFFIEGVFMQAGIPNKNRRYYKPELLVREATRYIKDHIKENRAYGELGHPSGPTINLERCSHMIKSLREDGNDWIGKAKILDTPFGLIVQNLMHEGAKLGVSSRGVGSLVEQKGGLSEVQDDYHLATPADIVADPSAPSAFVKGIMEGADWWFDESHGWRMASQAAEIQEELKKLPKRRIDEAVALRAFNKMLRSI